MIQNILLIVLLIGCILLSLLIIRHFFKGSEKLIENFKTDKNILESFSEFIESVEGKQQLQVVEVHAKEVFTLTSNSEIFWHLLSLPTVKILCTANVSFIYYISLSEDWHVAKTENSLTVFTPPIQWNKPSIDIPSLQCDFTKKSFLRNNSNVKSQLISQLHILTYQRAKQKIPYITDTARSSVHTFLTSWLSQLNMNFENIEIGIPPQ